MATDAQLMALLAETRHAEARHARACLAGDVGAGEAAREDLAAALAVMADAPADGLAGIAAKAARLCASLRRGGTAMDEGGYGTRIDYTDAPVATSLAADLARLVPEVVT
ncbi:hypothetical protein [Falsiroseomonas sp. E2-1-a20]|uniref:hypothetical protein n=1 Tax=Falsiroseomonas sp. E2-1-a20 TaxID=3239300 RepID=UPI003F2DAC6A